MLVVAWERKRGKLRELNAYYALAADHFELEATRRAPETYASACSADAYPTGAGTLLTAHCLSFSIRSIRPQF